MRGNFFNDIIQPIYDVFYINQQVIREGVLPGSSIIDLPQLPQLRTGYMINNILATPRPNEAYDGNEPLLISMFSLQPKNSIANFLYFQNSMAQVRAPLRDVNALVLLENNSEIYRQKDRHGPVPIAAEKTVEELVNYCSRVRRTDYYEVLLYRMYDISNFTYQMDERFNVFNVNIVYKWIHNIFELYEKVQPFIDLSKSDLTKHLYNSPLRNDIMARNAVKDMRPNLDIFSFVLDIHGNKKVPVRNMFNFTVASNIILQGFLDAALNISFNATQGTENEFNTLLQKLPLTSCRDPEKLRYLSEHFLLDLSKMKKIEFKLCEANNMGIPMYDKYWLDGIHSKNIQIVLRYIKVILFYQK